MAHVKPYTPKSAWAYARAVLPLCVGDHRHVGWDRRQGVGEHAPPLRTERFEEREVGFVTRGQVVCRLNDAEHERAHAIGRSRQIGGQSFEVRVEPDAQIGAGDPGTLVQ